MCRHRLLPSLDYVSNRADRSDMKITLTRRHGLLALATATAVATVGGATIALAGSSKSELASARTATAKFRSVSVAEAAGYAELRDAKKIACIAQPEYGGMGIH